MFAFTSLSLHRNHTYDNQATQCYGNCEATDKHLRWSACSACTIRHFAILLFPLRRLETVESCREAVQQPLLLESTFPLQQNTRHQLLSCAHVISIHPSQCASYNSRQQKSRMATKNQHVCTPVLCTHKTCDDTSH